MKTTLSILFWYKVYQRKTKGTSSKMILYNRNKVTKPNLMLKYTLQNTSEQSTNGFKELKVRNSMQSFAN